MDDKPTVVIVGGTISPAITDRVNVGTIGHVAVCEPEPVELKVQPSSLYGDMKGLRQRPGADHHRPHRKKGRNRRKW